MCRRLAPLLLLTLSLGRIHAHDVPDGGYPSPNTEIAPPPPLASGITYNYPDLVAYAKDQKAIRDSVSRVTPDFELELVSDAAKEVKYLDMYDDNEHARMFAILEATRVVIRRRCALPATIDPNTDADTLNDLAARLEVTFFEYTSLSTSSTWDAFCMAALLGKTTLTTLLPFLSQQFFNRHVHTMLQAAAVAGEFETFRAIATHSKLSPDDLQWWVGDKILFSGSVEFMQKIVALNPLVISSSPCLLEESIRLGHRSLFKYLYGEMIKHPLKGRRLESQIKGAFEALARRGWEDLFKRLQRQHSQWLNVKECLIAAVAYRRIDIVKYLLFHGHLGWHAKFHSPLAFEAAVGHGNIDAIDFLLGTDESGNPLMAHLSLPQPGPTILERVGESGRWDGIDYLMQLKKQGDVRFRHFKLAGNASRAVRAACCCGNPQVLGQLLQRDSQGQFVFDFDDSTDLWHESLLLACEKGDPQTIRELFKNVWVNPAANDNEALLIACLDGNHRMVRELLRNSRVASGARDGKPLIAACGRGHLLVVRELLQKHDGRYIYNVDPAVNDNAPLIEACDGGHLPVVRELLRHESVKLGARDGGPLISACRAGQLPVVRELLQQRNGLYVYNIEPDVQDNQALITACEFGHLPVVQELLRHERVDAGARNNTPLISACRGGELLIVQELLQSRDGHYVYNVNPVANDNEALIAACKDGNLLVVRELLQHDGVDPGARNNAPLIAACEFGNLPVVRELLQHERVDAGARTGEPLIAACRGGHLPVVQELLQKNKDGKYIYNVTPAARNNQCLISACTWGRLNIVAFLLQRRPNAHGAMEYEHTGIDVAAQDNTALLKAVRLKRYGIVEFLLQKTDSGDYLFPGIAITDQMRQTVAYKTNMQMRKLLGWRNM